MLLDAKLHHVSSMPDLPNVAIDLFDHVHVSVADFPRLPVDFYLNGGSYWLGLMNGTEPDYDRAWYGWAPSIIGGAGLAFALEGNVVPEPGTMFLLGSGLIGLAGARRKRKQI